MTWALLVLHPLAFANPGIHPSRVLVKAEPGVHLALGETLGPDATVVDALRVPDWYVVETSDPRGQVPILARHPEIAVAETDATITLDTDPTALDPSFPEQWGLENQPSRGGHWDADIDVLDAWSQGATGQGVLVAIVDSGLDLDHPAIAGRLWTNPDEIADNGVDDDGNGIVDDLHGADFVNLDGDPSDTHGHGTLCAGVVAAEADGISSMGVAPDARIMGVQLFHGGGTDEAFTSVSANSIVYAAEEGADVLSNSWRYGRKERQVVTDAIQYAVDLGAVVVFSAGNVPLNTDEGGFFPANTPVDEVITVAATTRHDELVYFDGLWASAFGENTVELSAPGDGVLAPELGGAYVDFSGTSASAPMVAGAAALMLSVAPDLTPAEVREILVDSADPLGLPLISGGRLNAGGAVRMALSGVAPAEVAISAYGVELDAPSLFTAYGPEDAEYTWYFPDTGSFTTGRQIEHTFAVPGPWTVVLEAVSPDGRRGRDQVTVDLPIPWEEVEGQGIESQHDIHPNLGAWAVETGEDAVWTRLHFSRIDLNSNNWNDINAVVSVFDESGLWVWSFEGSEEDVWTPPIRSNSLALTWVVDGDAKPSWGLHLDRVQAWRPGNEPLAEPDVEVRDPVASLRGGRACQTGPGPGWLGLLLLLALRRRPRS